MPLLLFYRKWLTNPVRKLSTNKIERGPGTIQESQGDILERQIAGRLGAIKVGNYGICCCLGSNHLIFSLAEIWSRIISCVLHYAIYYMLLHVHVQYMEID